MWGAGRELTMRAAATIISKHFGRAAKRARALMAWRESILLLRRREAEGLTYRARALERCLMAVVMMESFDETQLLARAVSRWRDAISAIALSVRSSWRDASSTMTLAS